MCFFWRGCLWLLCQFLHSEHWIYGYWKSIILLLSKAKMLINGSNIQNTHRWTSQEASTSTKSSRWGDMSYTCYEGILNNPYTGQFLILQYLKNINTGGYTRENHFQARQFFFNIVLGNRQKLKILSWARGNKLLILLARLLKINSRIKCTKTHNTLHWDQNSILTLFCHDGYVFVL